ncbi:MAG: DUF5050 domain-containing protein [bacterium]|nr:DUF5050 domain-containing protein [bacterium]
MKILFYLTTLFLVPSQLLAAPAFIYITDSQIPAVLRSEIDGSSVTTLVSLAINDSPRGITIDNDNNRIFWGDSANGSIFQADLDGSNVTLVTANAGQIGVLDMDTENQKLYWVNNSSPSVISRCDFDGKNFQTIFTSISALGPTALALDLKAEKVYFADIFDSKINSMDLDGGNVTGIVSNISFGNVPDVALDTVNGHVYWIDESASQIERANLDGSSATPDIIVANVNPNGIELDTSGADPVIYWVNNTGSLLKFTVGVSSIPTTVISNSSGDLSLPNYFVLADPPPFTPDTTIDDAPEFEVNDSINEVTVTCKEFSKAILPTSPAAAPFLALVNKTPQIRYETTVKRSSDNKIKKSVSKNNRATFKLPAGTYSATYNVKIVTAVKAAKKAKKAATLNAQIAALKKLPGKANEIQEKKAKLKLAGVKVQSTSNESPVTAEFSLD